MKRRRPLKGVRIPLPRQRGGIVESKKVYKRRPRTERLLRPSGWAWAAPAEKL